MKQVVSFSIEEEDITKLFEISLSIGKSRSEVIDILIKKYHTPEMKIKAEQILHLQSEMEMKKP